MTVKTMVVGSFAFPITLGTTKRRNWCGTGAVVTPLITIPYHISASMRQPEPSSRSHLTEIVSQEQDPEEGTNGRLAPVTNFGRARTKKKGKTSASKQSPTLRRDPSTLGKRTLTEASDSGSDTEMPVSDTCLTVRTAHPPSQARLTSLGPPVQTAQNVWPTT